MFHSGSNSGTPWHFKKGLAHALVGISGNLLTVCQFNVRAEITVDSLTTASETLPRRVGEIVKQIRSGER